MKILIVLRDLTLPSVTDEEVAMIEEASGGAEVVVASSPGEAIEHCIDAEVILGSIERDWFLRAQNLRWISAVSAGIDALLYPELVDGDVLLTGEKGLVGEHLGDHAFALLLALTRQLKRTFAEGPASWNSRLALRRSAVELNGLTAGIVGLGGTGRSIAVRSRAFGMDVIAVDVEDVPVMPEVSELWAMDRFPDLLQRSDVVFVCCPLTRETHNLFGAKELAQMKSTAFLINVTRGPIIDDEALVAALTKGEIAGAGLDVVPVEPLPADHPYWQLANVVMTPHTAGASPARAHRNVIRFVENLKRYRAGQPLEGLVDKHKGY